MEISCLSRAFFWSNMMLLVRKVINILYWRCDQCWNCPWAWPVITVFHQMRSGSVRPVGVKAVLKGRLHLQLANIGHPVEGNVMKAGTLPLRDTKVVVQEDGSGAFLGGSVNLGTRPSGKDTIPCPVESLFWSRWYCLFKTRRSLSYTWLSTIFMLVFESRAWSGQSSAEA